MVTITRYLVIFSLLGLVGAAPAATSRLAAGVKPVIGKPVGVPAQPVAGRQFAVSYKVTRSDTRGPLLRGTMICDPSVAGKIIRHAESFRAGTARLSFIVPTDAQGQALRVRLTIKLAAQSATRTAIFRVSALPKPMFSIGDASVVEGNTGSTTLSFPVTLSAATPLIVSARYATTDGTALAGSDYTSSGGTITLRPGQTTTTITVPITGDVAVEPDETVTVALTAPTNATIADGNATGTITNDDIAAHSGHYTGSTSQWSFIAFDVGEGATSLSGVFFFVDLTCDTPLSILRGVKLQVLDPIPVAPDGSFAATASGNQSNILSNLSIAGKLSAPGSATGTLKIVDITSNEPPFRGAHCWTNDLSWTAS